MGANILIIIAAICFFDICGMSLAQTCSIDFEACQELVSGGKLRKKCEQRTTLMLQRRADCYGRKLNDLRSARDCNCGLYQITNAVTHMSSPDINRTAKFMCMNSGPLKNCASRSCLKASNVHIFSKFFEPRCGPKERKMVAVFDECLKEYEGGKADFSKCGFIDYTLSRHSKYYRALLNVMCTGCPIMRAISKCNKERTVTTSPCRNIEELKLHKACVAKLIEKHAACGPDGRVALDAYVGRFIESLRLQCKAQQMYELAQTEWGCSGEFQDDAGNLVPENKREGHAMTFIKLTTTYAPSVTGHISLANPTDVEHVSQPRATPTKRNSRDAPKRKFASARKRKTRHRPPRKLTIKNRRKSRVTRKRKSTSKSKRTSRDTPTTKSTSKSKRKSRDTPTKKSTSKSKRTSRDTPARKSTSKSKRTSRDTPTKTSTSKSKRTSRDTPTKKSTSKSKRTSRDTPTKTSTSKRGRNVTLQPESRVESVIRNFYLTIT